MINQEKLGLASNYDGSSSSESEFNDGYESDLMAGEHDRALLEMMSEKERETELFKRAERRDMLKRQWEIKKKIKHAKKKESEKVTEEEPKNRIFERKKNIEVTKIEVIRNTAMAQLKAEREVKMLKKDSINEITFYDNNNNNDKSNEDIIIVNDKNENTLQNYKLELTNFQPILISTLGDLNKLRVPRSVLEEIIENPLFDETIIGLYLRVNIGKPNQVNPYRVAEVIGITESPKEYTFGNKRIKKVLKLRIVNKHEMLRLEYISNLPFENHEFQEWVRLCSVNGIELPRIDQIKEKERKIALVTDVQKQLKKASTGREPRTVINFALKKSELLHQRDIAINEEDLEKISKIDEEIKELNEQAEQIEKTRTASIRNIAFINERNRRLNISDSEFAIHEEMRAKEAKKEKGEEAWDPFIRRTTKPSIPFKSYIPLIKNEPIVISDNVPKVSNPQIISQSLVELAKTPKVDMTMYELHDFEIDIDIDMSNKPLTLDRINLPPIKTSPVQKSLPYGWRKWEEYKKKKGMV